jgi:hypothetical protein
VQPFGFLRFSRNWFTAARVYVCMASSAVNTMNMGVSDWAAELVACTLRHDSEKEAHRTEAARRIRACAVARRELALCRVTAVASRFWTRSRTVDRAILSSDGCGVCRREKDRFEEHHGEEKRRKLIMLTRVFDETPKRRRRNQPSAELVRGKGATVAS